MTRNAKVEVVCLEDADELAYAAAQRWLSSMNKADHYAAAFSGGRIAVKFFQALAAHPERELLCRLGMSFFFADERCVPPDDPESNFRLMKEHLLDPLRISPAQVHRIRGEEPPKLAAEKAAQDMLKNCEVKTNQVPLLDLIFLGMGEDGHVASLFPGDREIDSPEVYRAVVAPKPPPNRITLGLPVIVQAREVWVLISGAGKEAALRESLDPDGRTPLAKVVQGRSQTCVFSDVKPATAR